MDTPQLKTVIYILCNRAVRERAKLTQLDQAVGDGDFGINIERGAQAIIQTIKQLDDSTSPQKLLVEIATKLNAAGCGTAGTLVSFGILRGATHCEQLGSFLEMALCRIQTAGKTQLGEKTLVDALAPAVEVIKRGGTLEEAAEAAKDGAERTRSMPGTKGRSLYSHSRAMGIADPGASLVAALFDEAVCCRKELMSEKNHR